jgi:hypothetical protein
MDDCCLNRSWAYIWQGEVNDVFSKREEKDSTCYVSCSERLDVMVLWRLYTVNPSIPTFMGTLPIRKKNIIEGSKSKCMY